MSEIKVSVIIPVYNAEKYIGRCVDSIRKQTLRELEIILVDDGSTDASRTVCEELCGQDERIKLVSQKNAGPGAARNLGLETAEGEYAAFVDSDDYIDADMYRTMYEAVKGESAESCICGYYEVDLQGNRTENPNPLGGNVYEGREVQEQVLLNILGARPDADSDFVIGISVWKGLYSMEVIRRNELSFYSDRVYYSEDTMFNVDFFLRCKKAVMLSECFYYYVKNDTSFTTNYKADMHQKNLRFYNCIEEKLRQLDCFAEARMRLQRLFLGFVRYYVQRIVELFPRRDAIAKLNEICRDDTVQRVLGDYPYPRNPLKQRLIHFMMHKKKPALVWLFVKAKNR